MLQPAPLGLCCIRREGTSEAVPEAVRQAVGGGCPSGWGQLLSVTNAVEAGTRRSGRRWLGIGWAPWTGGGGGWHKALVVGSVSLCRRLLASRLEGGAPPLPMHPCPWVCVAASSPGSVLQRCTVPGAPARPVRSAKEALGSLVSIPKTMLVDIPKAALFDLPKATLYDLPKAALEAARDTEVEEELPDPPGLLCHFAGWVNGG